MKPPRVVGIYGVGHFGYGLLQHLATKGDGIELRAFDRNQAVRDTLATQRRHPYHASDTPVPDSVRIVETIEDLVDGLDALVLAVASASTREVIGNLIESRWPPPWTLVNTAKALDFRTGRRLSDVVAEQLKTRDVPAPCRYAALAGGTIASDLLSQHPLGITIASEDPDTLRALKPLFSSPSLWVQVSTDLAGVEYAGAFKNVIAICAGMARGLGLSYGAETHLISRMAHEVEEFCVRQLGARPDTFGIGSQCWGSDLWMSCTGPTRNRALGEMLGQGKSLEQANQVMALQNRTIEGVQTLLALESLFAAHPGQLRLLRSAEAVILHGAPARGLIDALMRDEADGTD